MKNQRTWQLVYISPSFTTARLNALDGSVSQLYNWMATKCISFGIWHADRLHGLNVWLCIYTIRVCGMCGVACPSAMCTLAWRRCVFLCVCVLCCVDGFDMATNRWTGRFYSFFSLLSLMCQANCYMLNSFIFKLEGIVALSNTNGWDQTNLSDKHETRWWERGAAAGGNCFTP